MKIRVGKVEVQKELLLLRPPPSICEDKGRTRDALSAGKFCLSLQSLPCFSSQSWSYANSVGQSLFRTCHRYRLVIEVTPNQDED